MEDRGTPASKAVFDYDAELSRYQPRLREAFDVRPGDSVLDIGCGAGQTTRESARLATGGSALGVDVSAGMVARARELTAAEGLDNVRFEQADAQVHPFPPERFTLGTSRFGTMFFADPVEAFGNVRRALRPGGRLVQLVWQAGDRQEWVAAIQRALAGRDPAPVPPAAGGPFSLADPAAVEGVLTTAGFTDVSVSDVSEPVYYGADPDSAADAVLALRMASEVLVRLDAQEVERALDRLRAVMAEHSGTDGVWFDSRAWLVTARR
ncbi:class I SAM-dependent methyltransferase [Umezawaea endophytica]|uniref:Methyltransferase domain-containing protein n=1 Tax=Umezawaea endophytica TaxID=1654476 RepID=A0A9X2VHL3_9PSEU|nr:class I SAM-dependent methyltransferase [Umezawaea endophytica]MCS7476870.1 methyltransferase domain-containing protein [Umezawaea endophytica]